MLLASSVPALGGWDAFLRLVVAAGAGQLQPAHEDIGLGLKAVAVDPALDVRGQPAVARLPRHPVHQIWIRPRHREFAKLAL